MKLTRLLESADFIKKLEITPEEGSIGKSAKDGKWYGWSHRAYYGFGVGSQVKKGDCGYDPKRGEWTARTDADAKQMALEFAESVS